MARLTITGFDGKTIIETLATAPDNVLTEMAEAGAKVIENAQRNVGKRMGVHRTGVTLGSIAHTSPKRSWDGVEVSITFEGTNKDGNRNAEVAFINEYGKRGQPARPFVRTANEEAADDALRAQEAVYDKYING